MPATKSRKSSRPSPLTGIDRVGQLAGQVWHCLSNNGKLSLTQLTKEIDAPRDQVMQAVGWLAREGKLQIDENGRSRSVSLC